MQSGFNLLFDMKAENTKMKCIVVDDESIAIEGVLNYIEKLDFIQVLATPSSAVEARRVLELQEVDLMFLDINMPAISGLEFLESLDKAPLVILTTAYSEYALDGFRLGVVDYLLKPFTFARFFQAVSKARDIFFSKVSVEQSAGSCGMFIRQGDTFRRIEPEQIRYAESMQNYVKLHFADEMVVIHQTMSSLEEMLPSHKFFRIHRSYLINIDYIDSISGSRIFVKGTPLPLSAQRMEEFLNKVVYKNLISK